MDKGNKPRNGQNNDLICCCVVCGSTSKQKSLKTLETDFIQKYCNNNNGATSTSGCGDGDVDVWSKSTPVAIAACSQCTEKLNSVIVGSEMINGRKNEIQKLEENLLKEFEHVKFIANGVLSSFTEIKTLLEYEGGQTTMPNESQTKLHLRQASDKTSNKVKALLEKVEKKMAALKEQDYMDTVSHPPPHPSPNLHNIKQEPGEENEAGDRDYLNQTEVVVKEERDLDVDETGTAPPVKRKPEVKKVPNLLRKIKKKNNTTKWAAKSNFYYYRQDGKQIIRHHKSKRMQNSHNFAQSNGAMENGTKKRGMSVTAILTKKAKRSRSEATPPPPHNNENEGKCVINLKKLFLKDYGLADRQQSTITLIPEVHLSEMLTPPPQWSWRESIINPEFCLDHFLEFYNNDKSSLKSQPFANYKLESWCFHDENSPMKQDLLQKLKIFGRQCLIKILEVSHCSTNEVIPETFYELIFGIQSLKKLVLNENNFALLQSSSSPEYSETEMEDLATKSKNIMKALPPNVGLQEVEIHGNVPFLFKIFMELFPNLKTVKGYPLQACSLFPISKLLPDAGGTGLQFVKRLDLQNLLVGDWSKLGSGDINETKSVLSILRHSKFPSLEELLISLGPCGDWDDKYNFNECLKSFSKSLKFLQIHRQMTEALPKNLFSLGEVKMTGLKELNLLGSVSDNLNFLEFMPNLRRLHVELGFKGGSSLSRGDKQWLETNSVWNNLKWSVGQLENSKAIELPFLEYLHIDSLLSQDDLKLLAKWAPSLKALNCIANNTTIGSVSSLWRLEELHLLEGSAIDDEGVTGVGSLEGWRNRMGKAAKPSLILLKSCLKRFSLKHNGGAPLTDLSVIGGFLLMEELEELHIDGSQNMSEAAVKLLRSSLPNDKFKLCYPPLFKNLYSNQ